MSYFDEFDHEDERPKRRGNMGTLESSRVWYSARGPIEIEHMDDVHILNTINQQIRRLEQLKYLRDTYGFAVAKSEVKRVKQTIDVFVKEMYDREKRR